jgi:hypothetical protein
MPFDLTRASVKQIWYSLTFMLIAFWFMAIGAGVTAAKLLAGG